MTIGHSTGTLFKPQTRSGLRLGITLIITLMVISSPIFMLVNPASAAATAVPSFSTDGSPSAPSTIGQDGSDFTTQAALSLTRASQTNNFVASKAYYDISFRTATAGVIKSVVMDFPTGTSVGSALVVEATGIGPGTLAASAGEVLTYTVTNAVNVPVNTIIRIQISNINNPPTPSASFTVSITTRDAANTPIDGPTPTLAYNMVQVGNAQIAPGAVTTTKIANGAVTSGDLADGSVTSTKPAESFMKKVTVRDMPPGHAIGWNPDGVTTLFGISGETIFGDTRAIIVNIDESFNAVCNVVDYTTSPAPEKFWISCTNAPPDGAQLLYVIETLPAHVI